MGSKEYLSAIAAGTVSHFISLWLSPLTAKIQLPLSLVLLLNEKIGEYPALALFSALERGAQLATALALPVVASGVLLGAAFCQRAWASARLAALVLILWYVVGEALFPAPVGDGFKWMPHLWTVELGALAFALFLSAAKAGALLRKALRTEDKERGEANRSLEPTSPQSRRRSSASR